MLCPDREVHCLDTSERSMKQVLKAMANGLSKTRAVRGVVANVFYPVVLRCLLAEVQADTASPSGLVETLAWKIHSYQVLAEELAEGKRWYGSTMQSNRETRAAMLKTIEAHLA